VDGVNAIVFDLDGTLLDFSGEYRAVVADAFEAVAGETREQWLDTYDEAFFDAFERCEPDPVRTAFARTDCGADPDALAAALLEREIEAWGPPENVHADLERLGADHRLGVLTNGVADWQRAKLDAHDLLEQFDTVVASYEAGAHKPAVEPFEVAERRLGADAYAMVGDDDADIEGATRAGWTAHRYRGGGFGDLPDALGW
jgi:putative hydrolase of the HAD superfamily